MANIVEVEALGDEEIGNGESPAADPPAPLIVLEQARLGRLDLFETELESGNHPLDFKAGGSVQFNRTPLHLAAMEGHEEIVDFILSRQEISRGVVNAKDDFGYTPLHLAVRHSHENVVRRLTTSSLVLPERFLAATSERDELGGDCGGCTPLHLAAVGGHIAIAKLLLQQPCQEEFTYDPVNILAMTWHKFTPLGLARKKKFYELAKYLEASDLDWLQQERTRIVSSANAILVGAALVAAATVGAALHPSSVQSLGFYWWVPLALFSVVSLFLGILAMHPDTDASLHVDLRRRRVMVKFAICFVLLGLLTVTLVSTIILLSEF